MIRFKQPNPHVPIGVMRQKRKEELLKMIHSPDIKEAGSELRKETLMDWLNHELNHLCDDIEEE